MLSLFRKKKTFESVSGLAANVIEAALVTGTYFNTAGRFRGIDGSNWMCICLYDLQSDGMITGAERDAVANVIMRRLKGSATLASYLRKRDVDVDEMCPFEYRITLSNFWWRFIRELRGQPMLGEANV